MMKSQSREFDLESIHSLSLRSQNISGLGCLGECVGLERLDLSFNDVTKLFSLAGLTNLVYLNLAANRISSLDGLQSLDNLQKLNLAGNLIGSLDTLRCLSCLEKLRDLRLQDTTSGLSNPICMNVTYKSDVTTMLPILVILDGERLKGRGSDLFKLYEQLDEELKESNETPRGAEDLGGAGSWVPSDFWDKRNTSPQKAVLLDAEQQLRELLKNCEDLSKSAAGKIQEWEENR
ncbi:leucine-rich repeat-containing protein 61 isoform X2 [Lingula anatina]|nr:leucine-rich repeat-containing protein 61 isoform X2 [Lingula anatina]|eukprot:XP_013407311.1 leucine-rich repeat-containing protein 61 isoform X2 [Lingula anatina]